jgi:hypothetical protein
VYDVKLSGDIDQLALDIKKWARKHAIASVGRMFQKQHRGWQAFANRVSSVATKHAGSRHEYFYTTPDMLTRSPKLILQR